MFDVADTYGEPLPELGTAQGDPSGNAERLKQFVSERGIQLDYSEAIYPAAGASSPGRIVLLPGQPPAEEFASMVHEVAHLMLRHHRRRAETCERIRETEAEAVAYVVCEAIGLKADSSVDYIKLYSGDKQTLAQSLQHVQQASAAIISSIAPDS